MARGIPHFPGPYFGGHPALVDEDHGNSAGNPFQMPEAAAHKLAPDFTVRKARMLFYEKVRKNKMVESVGPVIFTRLKEPDHAKMLATLMKDQQAQGAPVKVRALAMVLPRAAYRKLVLEDKASYEEAQVKALAGGAEVLMNASLAVLSRQRTHLLVGRRKHGITDYGCSMRAPPADRRFNGGQLSVVSQTDH